jgi:outer membrane biosynthesis protein TonB
MDRAEKTALAIAAAGHAILFGVLSVGFLATPNPDKLKPVPVEISFADQVALESTAPVVSSAPEAPKKSPVEAPVEPETAPPEPVREPDPQPIKPKPQPPKPAPAPAPAPVKQPTPPQKPTSAAPPSYARQPPKRDVRPTGNLDGLDIGRTNNKTESKATTPPAAVMSAAAAADIGSAIKRQVQPCADRQVSPGPGAENIVSLVQLQFNRDGSLAAPPKVISRTGVDADNERYVTRVDDAVRSIFAGCSPLRGFPPELYDVPRGWKSFKMNYRLNPRG